jgi:HEPN domain-containing protein
MDNQENNPPRTHDLEHLYSETNLQFSSQQLDLLRVMNSWNLEGRYQDYKDKFYKSTTEEYTRTKIEDVNQLRLWLLSGMQSR